MSVEPLLLLRADSGPRIGSGHVSRLLSLGEAWIEAGGRASLFTAGISKEMSIRAGERGIEIVEISFAHPHPSDLATLKSEVCAAGSGVWAAVDGYHFDSQYYGSLRDAGARVLAVDDSTRLDEYPVDILLDQNSGSETRNYPIPDSAMPLLGPRWALLRRNASSKPENRRIESSAERILVSFGGADPEDATGTVIRALKRLKRPYRALVVGGPENPRGEALEKLAEGAPITVKKSVDMAAEMEWADLAILGGGVTMLEACVAGLPALIATVAANQEAGSRALAGQGAVRLLGRASELSEKTIAMNLDELLDDGPARRKLSSEGRAAVDGCGAERVAAVMLALSQADIDAHKTKLRLASPADAVEVWRIANEPSVRASSFHNEPIPLDAHFDWYGARLAGKDERFWIIEVGGAIAAQIRYVKDGDAAEVHYSVRSAFRGRGLGTLALAATKRLACKELGARRLTGVVIAPNVASERSFISAGWIRKGAETRDGKACAIFEAACS